MAKTFIFNPDNDLALANGDPNYLPPKSARRMAEDLAMLPAWWAEKGDTILIPNTNGLYYWKQTLPNGLHLPEVEWITDKEPLPTQELAPWGWNPSVIKRLSLRGISQEWMPDKEGMNTLRGLSSRLTAVKLLEEITSALASIHPVIGKSHACTTEEEIANKLSTYERTMLKAPWSSSGKGLRRGQGIYAPPLSGWCTRILEQQGAVVVEPLYYKVKDFAMEFYADATTSPLSFVGYSYFQTDENGAYEGNLLTSDESIEKTLSTFVPIETLLAVREWLQNSLPHHLGGHYKGYIGVDMMICLSHPNTTQEEYVLHPCVEINLRMNMGVVAHILHERYVAPERKGRYMVEYFPTPMALKEAHLSKMEKYPLTLSPDGRIIQGYHPLTPIGKETQYCASILID